MAGLTSPPELFTEGVKALSETIMKPVYEHPELTEFCDVYTGIKHDTQIVIMDGELAGLMGRQKADCDKTPADLSFGFSEKLWALKRHGDRDATCYATVEPMFLKYALKPGMAKEDLTGTDWADFMNTVFARKLREMWVAKAWYSDSAMAAGTNNNLLSAQLPYFNQQDGWWKQIFTVIAANSAQLTVNSTLQSLNAAATFALQKFTSTHTTNQLITGVLDQMYYDGNTELVADKNNLRYLVSRSIYNQYERERKAVSNIDLAYTRMENGVDALKCNGIPVVPVDSWDKLQRKYFGQDATNVATYNPHRALLIKKSNLGLGTEDTGSMSAFDMFYDKVSGNNYIDWAANVDFKLLVDSQFQAAY